MLRVMRVYRYWARGRCDRHGNPTPDGDIIGVGWSDVSQVDAERHAQQQAQRIAQQYQRDELSAAGWYYPDRPIREPVLGELHVDGRLLAVTTRNIYGLCVLNAAGAMFADIDVPAPPSVGLLGRVFGKRSPALADDTPARVAEVVARHRGMGMRLYRTAAGYRGLVTHRPFDPTAGETLNLLRDFGSDRLYV